MKKIRFTAILLLSALMLCACKSGGSLADVFSEDEVRTKAEEAIELFNAKEYQSLIEMGNDEFQAAVTVEQFETAGTTAMDKLGEFKSVDNFAIAGQKDNEKNDYAAVVAVGEYEQGKMQFTMAFDDEMKLVQFFIK